MSNSTGNESANGKNVYVKPTIDEGDDLPGAAAGKHGIVFTPAIAEGGPD
ncbi:MAG: hypothetical protein M1358_22500 [Chloroflexi bacterium]|nr:hypothetical protein [Chloroflexota bacterium]